MSYNFLTIPLDDETSFESAVSDALPSETFLCNFPAHFGHASSSLAARKSWAVALFPRPMLDSPSRAGRELLVRSAVAATGRIVGGSLTAVMQRSSHRPP